MAENSVEKTTLTWAIRVLSTRFLSGKLYFEVLLNQVLAVDRYVVLTILKSMGFLWVVGQVEDIAWTLMDLIKPESERAVFLFVSFTVRLHVCGT